MSQSYEALVILKAIGTESELAQSVSRVEEPIKRFGGRIGQSTNWGRRRLTYRILRQTEGYYHLVEFDMAADQINEVKRAFQLNDGIVRFIILNRNGTSQPAPAKAAAA